MGADGGVLWYPVNDGCYNRVCTLLAPFWSLTSTSGLSYWAEEALDEWEKQNPAILAPRYLVGVYGTDCEMTLEDLANNMECPPDLVGYTWADLLELELHKTAPKDMAWVDYDVRFVAELLHCHCRYSDADDLAKQFSGIAPMQISAWFNELKECVRWNERHCEGTWT